MLSLHHRALAKGQRHGVGGFLLFNYSSSLSSLTHGGVSHLLLSRAAGTRNPINAGALVARAAVFAGDLDLTAPAPVAAVAAVPAVPAGDRGAGGRGGGCGRSGGAGAPAVPAAPPAAPLPSSIERRRRRRRRHASANVPARRAAGRDDDELNILVDVFSTR